MAQTYDLDDIRFQRYRLSFRLSAEARKGAESRLQKLLQEEEAEKVVQMPARRLKRAA